MKQAFFDYLDKELSQLKQNGLFKGERVISSQQQAEIEVADGTHVLNFCSNNYLGLANNPELIQSAVDAIQKYGFGMSSVRFICGTQTIHKQLENRISQFLG